MRKSGFQKGNELWRKRKRFNGEGGIDIFGYRRVSNPVKNLHLMSRSEHGQIHYKERKINQYGYLLPTKK